MTCHQKTGIFSEEEVGSVRAPDFLLTMPIDHRYNWAW